MCGNFQVEKARLFPVIPRRRCSPHCLPVRCGPKESLGRPEPIHVREKKTEKENVHMKKLKKLGLFLAMAMMAAMLMAPAYADEAPVDEPAAQEIVLADGETTDEAAPAEEATEETAEDEAAVEAPAPKSNPIMSIVIVAVVIAIVVIAWTYNKRDNKKKITYG